MREFLKCPLCVHAYIHSMKNEDCISFLSFFNIFREVTFTHGRILGRSVDCEKVQKNREIDSFVTPLIKLLNLQKNRCEEEGGLISRNF